MGMPAEVTRWTAAMVRALPDDGKRYEVLDGELWVSPASSWRHQWVLQALFKRLDPVVEAQRLGRILWAPADIEFSDGRLLQPDLFVVPLVDGRPPNEWAEVRRLLLVVEVLSPSTSRVDRGKKRRIYFEEQVPEYWIVHPEAQIVERWRPGAASPEIIDDTLRWQPSPDSPDVAIDLDALFAEARGA
jgi:Uma2 family endonuclease